MGRSGVLGGGVVAREAVEEREGVIRRRAASAPKNLVGRQRQRVELTAPGTPLRQVQRAKHLVLGTFTSILRKWMVLRHHRAAVKDVVEPYDSHVMRW